MIEIILFVIGVFFGSFFGVLIDRIPKGKDVVGGRSKCDFCKKDIKWYDLIPLLSFLILKGKCRNCKRNLSYFYPTVEFLTGFLFVFTFIKYFSLGAIPFFYYLLVLCSLFIIFFIDLKYTIIPDKIVFPIAVIAVLYNTFFERGVFLNHLLSGVAAFLFFFIISYVFYFLTKKVGMGGGDIKLSFLLGAFLGFPNILISLYIAFLTAAIASIILIIWKKMRFRKDSVPFGPFLITGAFISIIWGNQLYAVFLKLLGF